MLTFVGGVRDTNGARGFIPIAPRAVVAVDLATGTRLWQRERIGRPIAATSNRLVTLGAAGDSFVLNLFDALTGEDRGRANASGMPDWAEVGTDPDVVQVDAADTPDGVRLDWRIRHVYRGGAPPSAEVREAVPREAAGRLLLNIETGEATATEAAAEDAREAGPRDVLREALGPGVVAADRVDDRVFALKAVPRGQTLIVVLEAHDARSGALLWEVPLAEQAPSRPAPLRK